MDRPNGIGVAAVLLGVVGALVLPPVRTGAAQASFPRDRAAATITAASVAERLRAIADDSMGGRATPSLGLERTAAYVAAELAAFGLRAPPGMASLVQRWPIYRKAVDLQSSAVTFGLRGDTMRARFGSAARFRFGVVPPGSRTGGTLVIGGDLGRVDVDRLEVEGRIVLLVLDYERSIPAAANAVVGGLFQKGPAALVLVTNRAPGQFAELAAREVPPYLAPGADFVDGLPVVEVDDREIGALLRRAGVDLAAVREASTAVTRAVPGLTVAVEIREHTLDTTSAPNVVGLLEGRDSALRGEYVLISAHMDHLGVGRPERGDSIYNGADDNASGTAALLELARAYSVSHPRPRRSILFLAVSGEEENLWGSRYFRANLPVPVGQIVANVNLDMIGGTWATATDTVDARTVVVVGGEHSALGALADSVARAVPGLDVRPVADPWPEQNYFYRSDQIVFAQAGVPGVLLFTGNHERYHRPSDEWPAVDMRKVAGVARFAYWLGAAIADRDHRPAWIPESRRRIVR